MCLLVSHGVRMCRDSQHHHPLTWSADTTAGVTRAQPWDPAVYDTTAPLAGAWDSAVYDHGGVSYSVPTDDATVYASVQQDRAGHNGSEVLSPVYDSIEGDTGAVYSGAGPGSDTEADHYFVPTFVSSPAGAAVTSVTSSTGRAGSGAHPRHRVTGLQPIAESAM
eukprot:m.154733 g.154733  ORF g.154733 m.154733 type:complete len:165 (+) comp15133_c0_seq10:235-729(+)